MKDKKRFEEGLDYYLYDGSIIMTEEYHINRGYCCGSGCKHCPYDPIHTRDTINLQEFFLKKDNKNLDI